MLVDGQRQADVTTVDFLKLRRFPLLPCSRPTQYAKSAPALIHTIRLSCEMSQTWWRGLQNMLVQCQLVMEVKLQSENPHPESNDESYLK